ncbi:Zn-dependent protease (includes SpoIVFB) [Cyclobacterium lianum]|uniref:Zinc metalloprotease n=1 Tax=Cyclobacterium lianum TaxID=388280 RepID=A0A1M7QR87_9BACT|nr:site-2 protease family protein [Cyclobacterium lianum]SHN34004.1 Zn-dependent protease (includes SpoIVFB) [Cyclobacterium lianum]
MKFSLYLGRYSGIKVFIHWTFSLLLFWIVIANTRSGTPLAETGWTLLFIILIFLCVILHEFGHALTAQKFGIQTRDIILLPIGGLARLEKLPDDPKEELKVALAGPLVNLVIFFILLLILFFKGFDFYMEEAPALNGSTIWLYLASANFFLAVFNLLPAFPMDGGRVLRALLTLRMSRVKATEIAGATGQAMAILFVFFGLFNNPVLVLIGIFIFLGAQAEVNQTKQHSLLSGFTVEDALMSKFPVLAFDAPLQKAVEKLLDGQATHFVVVRDDQPIGTLSREGIVQGLHGQNAQVSIEDVTDKDPLKLEMATALEEALKNMSRQNKKVALVYEGHHFVGILDQENISEFIMVKDALAR